MERHAELLTHAQYRAVVRNGHAPGRRILTGVGPVEVRGPRIDQRKAVERDPDYERFTRSVLPRFLRRTAWNPHFHALVLEAGFDPEGTFVSIPFSGLQAMTEVFRRRVITLLVEKELLSQDFAEDLLSSRHSGFSIDNSVRVADACAQESLAQYIACPLVSLKKIRYEPFKGRVLYHIPPTHSTSARILTSSTGWTSSPS